MPSTIGAEQRVTYHTTGNEASRLYAKKTIVVGNVSKYVIKLSKSLTHPVVFLTKYVVEQVSPIKMLGGSRDTMRLFYDRGTQHVHC